MITDGPLFASLASSMAVIFNIFNTTIPMEDIPTPLIFFSPHLGYQLNIATYLHVGSTGALIWDVVDNLGNDLRLLYYHKVRLPTIVYFVARVSLLGFCLGRAMLLTIPIADCSKLENAINSFLIIYVASTTVISFGASWLAAIAMILTFSKTFSAVHIKNTQFCVEQVHGRFLGPTSFVLVTNDVLIYCAIAFRIYTMVLNSHTPIRQRFNILTFGTSLPALSRALIQDSQLYFLNKGISSISVYVFEPPLSVMFIVCHLVLVNILSCRVYRNLRMTMGSYTTMQVRGTTTLQFAPPTVMTRDAIHHILPVVSTTIDDQTSSTPNLTISPGKLNFVDIASAPPSFFHTEEKRPSST